jgi:galactonate dehydratase
MEVTLELFVCRVSDRIQWRIVRLTLPDGRRGVGECSDSGPLPTAVHALESLGPALADLLRNPPEDPGAVRAWADAALRRLPRTRSARTVLGGVEQTVCDVAARGRGVELWRWLGASQGRPIPVYANINRVPGGRSPADVARAAVIAVKDGHRALKCAPFDVADERLPLARAGVARLEAVRDAVGEDIELMVDCHLRLDPADVEWILPELHRLRVSWLEDAVDVEDVAGLTRLRELTGATLAGGEFAYAEDQLAPAVEAGLIDVVMPDVKHAGGITRAHALAMSAPGVRVAPHNPCGPVGTAASAHLFLALPHACVLEIATGEVPWRARLVEPPERVDDGCLTLAQGLGLGIDFDDCHAGTRLAWSTTL